MLLLTTGKSCNCLHSSNIISNVQKHPTSGLLRKRCSENMQQIYRRHPCQSAISIKLQSNFIEITLQHGCSPVNLLHIFRAPFLGNTSGGLLLKFKSCGDGLQKTQIKSLLSVCISKRTFFFLFLSALSEKQECTVSQSLKITGSI